MNKRKVGLILWSSVIFASLASGILASVAWFTTANVFDVDITGSVVEEYFHCGTGTESDPFVITRPIHYYHLVEFFQRETALDATAEFGTDYLYFQVGYDLDGQGGLEVYNYDNQGTYQGTYQNPSYSKTLNMAYYSGGNALLPIGTNEVPFVGSFDGSASDGIIIANLNIHCSETVEINHNSVNRATRDIGVFGYITADSEDNPNPTIIKNAKFDHVTIDLSDMPNPPYQQSEDDPHVTPHTGAACVGYIVGHINRYKNYSSSESGTTNASPLYNVYVSNATIQGGPKANSSFGYIGLVDTVDGTTPTSVDSVVNTIHGAGGGEGDEWGGSVNMKKMYNRLYDIADHATENSSYAFEKDIVTRENGTTFERDAVTGYAYTYRSQKEGSFVFTSYHSGTPSPLSNYMYINGGTRYHQFRQTKTASNSGYYISYNGHYLGANGTRLADHQDAWLLQNNRLRITINETNYYLTHDLTLSRTSTDTWTKSGNRLYYNDGGWFSDDYYLAYSNGWTLTTTRTNLTWTTTQFVIINDSSNGSDYMDYSGTNVTYFPLITESDSYEVTRKNTGYVIGGSEDKNVSSYPKATGDIRVSKYSTSNISASYTNGTLNTVYTINSSRRTVPINENDYTKYADSKAEFLEMINDGNIYGLHFMPANINQSHLITADYTLINGQPKTNYQMPASSIDFNVAEKGCINFFAGTYFGTSAGSTTPNNSFFSLHHIERDINNQITSIKEIAEVYKSSDDTKDYIYKYGDNSYSDTLTNDYSLSFSTNRIKVRASNSGWTNNAVYYFEILVNAGEYALGSVDGGTGAYLMYLDIATSGATEAPTHNQIFGVSDAALFTQIDFQTNAFTENNSFVINSCFNMAYVVPEGATKETFSISISTSKVIITETIDEVETDIEYLCYEIIIINTTGSDFSLNALLMDNDSDPDNVYPYMYAFKYNNGDRVPYRNSNSYTGESGGTSMTPVYVDEEDENP